MRLESDFRFHGPRERVWEALLDPELLAHALPGVRELRRVGEDEYRGRVEVGAGFLRAGSFQVRVHLRDPDAPRSCTLEVKGSGEAGAVQGVGRFELREPSPGVTHMRYVADLEVGGKVARTPRFLLETAARALARQGLVALDRALRARLASAGGT